MGRFYYPRARRRSKGNRFPPAFPECAGLDAKPSRRTVMETSHQTFGTFFPLKAPENVLEYSFSSHAHGGAVSPLPDYHRAKAPRTDVRYLTRPPVDVRKQRHHHERDVGTFRRPFTSNQSSKPASKFEAPCAKKKTRPYRLPCFQQLDKIKDSEGHCHRRREPELPPKAAGQCRTRPQVSEREEKKEKKVRIRCHPWAHCESRGRRFLPPRAPRWGANWPAIWPSGWPELVELLARCWSASIAAQVPSRRKPGHGQSSPCGRDPVHRSAGNRHAPFPSAPSSTRERVKKPCGVVKFCGPQ